MQNVAQKPEGCGANSQLAGGTASMQQLKERLEKDLLEESPQAARVKVLASGNATERRFRFDQCMDRREHISISWFIPADVVLQIRVRFFQLIMLLELFSRFLLQLFDNCYSKDNLQFIFWEAAARAGKPFYDYVVL
ncbi:Actin- protein 4 [Dionaea muscipula]